MKVKVKRERQFRLPKKPITGFRALFLVACFLLPAFYTYQGLKPFSADAVAKERLFVPSINLSAPVRDVAKTGATIEVPEVIAGAYSEKPNKTLLIGHSNTVFQGLKHLKTGTDIVFDGQIYQIKTIETKTKSEIDMSKILAAAEQPTIILMTCTGQHIKDHDYTHRLIITAKIAN